jgi:transposase
MSKVPPVIENCSVEDQIAALLYLGWTHEEIATAVNVSKGTVQNRRTALEGGNLRPPPEAFVPSERASANSTG